MRTVGGTLHLPTCARAPKNANQRQQDPVHIMPVRYVTKEERQRYEMPEAELDNDVIGATIGKARQDEVGACGDEDTQEEKEGL
ncbi:hypothetical protein GW17_00016061 [Ensete ventricosum]|nr:hypothetical protein GW17_00016061 [Ensete ventricosum]